MSADLTLALTGDSILQRRLLSRRDPVVQPLFNLIRSADVSFTNLETLANDFRGDPALDSGGSHFGAPAWVLDELSDAGFDLFATATNHALDYGVAGLLLTLDALDARMLSHAGAGSNLEEARRPVFHTHPNGTVAMVACTATFARGQEASAQRQDMPGRPGVNPLRFDTMFNVLPSHMQALREMAEGLGLESFRQMLLRLGFGFPPPDGVFPFGPLSFRAAEEVAQQQTAWPADVDDIARWVREARLASDVVLVSVHAHEHDPAATKEQPPGFLRDFARRMIDEGADVVVGHGPHLLRGMEVHAGKPIFYSLGNFIGQNELVPRLPSDSYARFRADPALTPVAVYRERTKGDAAGFPSDARYWETVVPILRFRAGGCTRLDLVPVSLGLGEARHLRGRPRLALGEAGRGILARFAALSLPFGTELAFDGDRAWLDLTPTTHEDHA